MIPSRFTNSWESKQWWVGHPPFPGFAGWGGHIQTFSRQPGPGKMSEFSGSGLSGLGNIDCRWPNRGLFIFFYVLENWNHNTSWLVPVFFRFDQVRSVHSCPPVPFCKIYIFVLFGLRMSSRRRLTGEREGNSNFSIQSESQRGSPALPTAADHGTTRLRSKHSYAKNSNQNSPQWTLAR